MSVELRAGTALKISWLANYALCMDEPKTVLISAQGPARHQVLPALFDAVSACGGTARDIEQAELHGRLVVSLLVDGTDVESLDAALSTSGIAGRADYAVVQVDGPHLDARELGQIVTVLAPSIPPATMSELLTCIETCGARVVRMVKLSSYPVHSYELTVLGGDEGELRRSLSGGAARWHIDVAVQRAGLTRRAKRLVVMDADSTVVRAEVIDLLAQRSGHGEEVAAITAAAMAGELDFEAALRSRVATLEGLELSVMEDIARNLPLMPGARTLIRTLQRLGYVTAIVSGGFTHVIDILARDLGVDYTAANTCEVIDGRLTGKLVGPIVDRAGKKAALLRFAELAGVPISQTVAVGDGANDIDMLSAAGLGIAFNAKPVVRDAADAAINVPFLDAVLFFFGIRREEIEAADEVPAL